MYDDDQTPHKGIFVVYDGECPFCSRYVAMLRLREAAGYVELIDARSSHPMVDEVVSYGFDLDDGMVAKIGDAYYAGADCVNVLSLLSTRTNGFNRLNYWMFRSRAFSRLLGRSKIGKTSKPNKAA